MTVTLSFAKEEEKKDFMFYMKEVYEYIDLDQEHIPAAFQELETEIIAYFTDDFFTYTYKFFIEQLMMGLSGTPKDRDHLEMISKYFRQGAEYMLMSNIVLDK